MRVRTRSLKSRSLVMVRHSDRPRSHTPARHRGQTASDLQHPRVRLPLPLGDPAGAGLPRLGEDVRRLTSSALSGRRIANLCHGQARRRYFPRGKRPMPVITIQRQYGAGGETIGAMVAQRLGAELVDRKIFEEVAVRLELTHDEVEKHEEAAGSFLSRVLQALGGASVEFAAPPEAAAWTPPYSDPAFDTRKAVLKVTQEVIREAARTGNAVIVGGSSGYVLPVHSDRLNGLVRASA